MNANEILLAPVRGAIASVFAMWPAVAPGEPVARRTEADVTLPKSTLAMIGLTGRFRGRIVFSFPALYATRLVSEMTGDPDPPAPLARSALSELANMLAGAAIRADACAGGDITPPTLFVARSLGITPLDGEALLLECHVAGGRFVALIAATCAGR